MYKKTFTYSKSQFLILLIAKICRFSMLFGSQFFFCFYWKSFKLITLWTKLTAGMRWKLKHIYWYLSFIQKRKIIVKSLKCSIHIILYYSIYSLYNSFVKMYILKVKVHNPIFFCPNTPQMVKKQKQKHWK